MESSVEPKKHPGSCHCGAVRFEVEVDTRAGSQCNCSVCTKVGATGGIVKPDAFKLLQGESELSAYEWGGKTAKRYFCKHCGITCFSRGDLPEVGGAYVSINFNALDDVELRDVSLTYWDGRHNNWEAGPRAKPWPIFSKE
jgi:hypothetical protein